MPRNKYPEETEKKIIDKAFELFLKKGYENTSIQDIIDATKLSKGAIYHHFDSKESILLTVYNRISERISAEMMKIVNNDTMTGCEKLQKMFMNSFKDDERVGFMQSMPNLLENPHFLALHIKDTMKDVVPRYIYPVLKQGIEDGSIKCDNPLETAHLIMVVSNVWLNPLIYTDTGEDTEKKVDIMIKVMRSLGVEIGIRGKELGERIDNVVDGMKTARI